MATVVLEIDRNNERQSVSTVDSTTAWDGDVESNGPSTDLRIGDDLNTLDYTAHVAYVTFNLDTIPETATITGVDLKVNVDIANVGTAFTLELYENQYGTGGSAGAADWPTISDLVTLEANGDLLFSETSANLTYGDHTLNGTAAAEELVQSLVRGDTGNTEIQMMLTSSRHRLDAVITASNSYVDIEDSTSSSTMDLTITYDNPSHIGDEVTTINSDDVLPDNHRITSTSTSFAVARAGTGTFTYFDNYTLFGQRFTTPDYRVFQAYEQFDISSIPSNAIITDVVFDPWVRADVSTTNFNIEVYQLAHSYPVTSTDWQNGTELQALYDAGKRVAWFPTSGIVATSTRYSLVNDGWVRLLQEAVDASETVFQTVAASSRTRIGTTPTVDEYIYWDSGDDASPSRIKVYYITRSQANMAILGAAF